MCEILKAEANSLSLFYTPEHASQRSRSWCSAWSLGAGPGHTGGNVDLEQGPATPLTDTSTPAALELWRPPPGPLWAGQRADQEMLREAGAEEQGAELVSSPSTRSALRLPPHPECARHARACLRAGLDSQISSRQSLPQPWPPSARGCWLLCQELRKQNGVLSGGRHSRTCSKEVPSTSKSGWGNGP